MARGGLQVGRPLEHNDRDGGSLAEADGQRNRASVASGPAYAIDDETAIKVVDGTVEIVSEGHWKLLTHSPEAG